MGDPLSVASGVAGLLSIAGLMFSRTYKFAKAAKGAESSIKTLADEIRTLAGLLQSLSLVAIELETGPTDSVFQLPYVISCQQVLLKIERRTREADPSNWHDNKVHAFAKKLKWPFSSAETMDLIGEITRHQRLMTVALSADSITHLQKLLSGQEDIRKGIRDIQGELERRRKLETRITLDKERQGVLRFFGSVDPTISHETNKGLRHLQTGLWLLSHETFLFWTRSVRSRLWLSGIPGAGKTVLASVVIEEMLGQCTPEKAAAYFYCDYKDERRQKLLNILGTIACQIARQDASQRSFGLLQDYYKSCHPPDKPACTPKATKLLDIIRDMSSSFDEVSIVVDALDECGSDREEVIEALAVLNEHSLSNIRTAFLSRDEPDIKNILEGFMHIPIAAHSDDLKIFVAEEIEARIRKRKLRIKSPALKNEIMGRLIHGADGMFRWVACQLDYLCTLPHDRARREALSSLPPDLNSTYERILGRIANQPLSTKRIVRDTLLWTMRATKPLAIEALCEALSVDESTTSLDPESQPDEEDILEYCSSLIRKVASGSHLELAHFTVQEYLLSDALKESPELKIFYLDQRRCTAYLAKACLRYLNCDDFSLHPALDYDKWQNFDRAHPFYSHATTEWNVYASHHWDDQDIRSQLQILFHLLNPLRFLNWAQNFAVNTLKKDSRRVSRECFLTVSSAVTTNGISPLHFAAMLQLEWLMESLLNDGANVNKSSQIGTPLHCALLGDLAILGQIDGLIIELPPDYDDLEPGVPDDCHSPKKVLRRILRLLFDFGADPALLYRGCNGVSYNALLIGMKTGHAFREMFAFCPKMTACFDHNIIHSIGGIPIRVFGEVVKLLDTQYLDPSVKTSVDEMASVLESLDRHQYSDSDSDSNSTAELKGEPSIFQAIQLDAVGHLEELLQERPESVNGTISGGGTTALHLAAFSGSIGAASILIALGADVEAQDNNGQTPMHKCAYGNGVDLLKLLLSNGADPGKVDNEGRTIWHVAAAQNNVAVLQVLLSHYPSPTSFLSRTDSKGMSPFFTAAQAFAPGSLRLLSRHTKSFEGTTEDGLKFAHITVGLRLPEFQSLVKDGMDICAKSNDSSSVLHHFVKICPLFCDDSSDLDHIMDMIGYLIEHGLSVGAIDENGQTPLHVLLSRPRWDTWGFGDPQDKALSPDSSLPLHQGEEGIIIDIRDKIVSVVVQDFKSELMSSLIKALATKDTINARDRNGVTPLEHFCSHHSLEEKDPNILQRMIEVGADITIKCSLGRAPLQVLFETHNYERPKDSQLRALVDLLIFMIDRLDSSDEIFKSPLGTRILYWAVENELLILTNKMLEKGVSPASRIPEQDFDSALDCACRIGTSRELLRNLLEACDTETRNQTHPQTGRNILHVLCSGSSIATSAELLELCISMGLDTELKDKLGGETPLFLAVRNIGYKKTNFARLLAGCGAETSIRNADGESLAQVAVMSRQLEALEVVDGIGALGESSPGNTRKICYAAGNRRLTLDEYSLWHLSACGGSNATDALRYLFDHGHAPDVDIPAFNGITALHITGYFGNNNALRYLLSKGADPKVSNNDGETALHWAAETGEAAIINILVSAGANVDAATSKGDLALHYAASHGENEAVHALLKLGSSYATNKKNVTPYLAARLGGHESTALLLQDYEVCNPAGAPSPQALVTIFRIAVDRGDIQLCRKLVERGVRTDAFHEYCETCTPVCVAFARNDSKLAELLVEHGFPVNGRLCTNSQYPEFTPALLALRHGNKKLLNLALKHSAYPELISKDCLIFASVYFQSHQSLEMLLSGQQNHTQDAQTDTTPSSDAGSVSTERNLTLKPLYQRDAEAPFLSVILDAVIPIADLQWVDHESVSKTANISIEDAEGISALHLAAALDDIASAKLLLQHGATVDVVSYMCKTPLHFAACGANADLVSYLIQYGANVDARDSCLETASMLAALADFPKALDTLCRAGADLSYRDISGHDVLYYACNSSAAVLAFVLSKGCRPTLDYGGIPPLGPALRSKYPGVPALALNSTLAFEHAAGVALVALGIIVSQNNTSLLRKLMRRASPSATPFPTSEHAKLHAIASILHVSVSTDQHDMVDVLLEYGADIEFHAEMEGTPLITACAAGRFSSVKLLVFRGATISYRKDGRVWSGVKAAERYPEIVVWLLCGRFSSQKPLSDRAHPETMNQPCRLWAGTEELEIPLSGELRRRWRESLLGQCIRISQFRRSRLGTVWEGIF